MGMRELREDKAMRDAALEIFRTDLTQIKADLQSKGFGRRIADRLGEGARDLAEDAANAAEANYGKISALAAGIALWTLRKPLLNFVSRQIERQPGEQRGEDIQTDPLTDESNDG